MASDPPPTEPTAASADGTVPRAAPDEWNRWPRVLPSVQEALERVFRSGDWGRYEGGECERLRGELGAYVGGRDVYLCASGTIGVELALRAVGVGAGDEVILAGYDFPGNFRAIEALGAIPSLADLRPGHWTPGPEQLAAAHSAKTVAVVVSHLHGDIAPMPSILHWAQAHGVAVVEDACQVPGAWIDGRPAGDWGDVSVLSFGGSKLLTAGRGGAVLSRDPHLMQRLRVHAQRGNDAYALSQLQATVLRPQLQSLDVDSRKRLAGATRLCELLRGVACLMPAEPCGATDRPAFYKLAWWYTGQNVSRDEFLQALQHAGLAIDAGFRGFLLRSPRRCRKPADLAASRRAAEQTLLLHHPVLLRDADTLQQLATIITSTAQRLAIVPPA